MMVLYLLQVLGRSVLMNLRNRATHFALFTTVSELILRFLQPTNNWCYHDNNKVATRTKCIFRHSIMEIEEGVIHSSYDTKAEFNNCFIIHSK